MKGSNSAFVPKKKHNSQTTYYSNLPWGLTCPPTSSLIRELGGEDAHALIFTRNVQS